jgi:hypothetical protein
VNLHSIVAPCVAAVNPTVTAMWQQSTSPTTNADYSQTAGYAAATPIPIQDQALSAEDLRHLDALNIQNVRRKVWANVSLQGVNRATGQGGDLLTFAGQTWKVVVVFETWDNDGPWSSVGLAQQNGTQT